MTYSQSLGSAGGYSEVQFMSNTEKTAVHITYLIWVIDGPSKSNVSKSHKLSLHTDLTNQSWEAVSRDMLMSPKESPSESSAALSLDH